MTALQVIQRAVARRRWPRWARRADPQRGLFAQAGPWGPLWAGVRARLTPTMDHCGYPAAKVTERSRDFHWVVRDMQGDALAEGACIDRDTAQSRADEAAKALGKWRLGWMPCA